MLGRKPQTKHPFYFALQYCESLYCNFDIGREVRLKISDIDTADISFTFGDSMAQMETQAMKPLFLKETLFEYIRAFHEDADQFLESIKKQYVCIEAQLWTDKYFQDGFIK